MFGLKINKEKKNSIELYHMIMYQNIFKNKNNSDLCDNRKTLRIRKFLYNGIS